MNNFLKLSGKDKIELINQTVIRKKLPSEAIEKDVWVTAVLRSLFALPYTDNISFKGGTSLSKCWNVIERFSEDIDIAINREYFGFMGETLSKREVNKKLRKIACSFCRETLQFDLAKQMIADGIPETLFSVAMEITDSTATDPEKIFINYKSLLRSNQYNNLENYIKPVVVLEVNARSMKEPLVNVEIQSFVDEVFAGRTFVDKPFPVAAVVPERTFLEKICLLHEEFAKEQDKVRVNRMSRHLYDIVCMLDTPIAEKALNNTELYKHIIAHRKTFIGLTDFDYDTLFPQTINIIPPENVIAKWEEDYIKMQTMVYGESPSFEEITEKIRQLNERIRRVVW